MHGYEDFIDSLYENLYVMCIDVFGTDIVSYEDFKENMTNEIFFLSDDSSVYKSVISACKERLLLNPLFNKVYKKYLHCNIDDLKCTEVAFLGSFELDTYSDYINIEIRKEKIKKLLNE